METRLTFPASIKLYRIARRDPAFLVERLGANPEWDRQTPTPTPADLLLARPGEPHAPADGAPVPVLVECAGVRPKPGGRWDGYAFRTCAPALPAGSFARVSREGFRPVVVESPELTVVRAAAQLTTLVAKRRLAKTEATVRIAALIDEFCGSYAHDPCSPKGDPAYDVKPLSTVERMRSYFDETARVPGLKTARAAVDLALDGLASPMEALVELLLCAPPRMGGLHLPAPVSNEPLVAGTVTHRRMVHDRIRPDLQWTQSKVVVEVNSHLHDTPEAMDEDARRICDYQAAGFAVFVFRSRMLSSRSELDGFLLSVARGVTTEGVPPSPHTIEQTIRLRSYQEARARLMAAV